ncbi:MAG: hypothetical protein KDA32_11485, partial [Phycisphaerales bacterium]|nr:hypothetical protein [Phycisphaerales bacterium]
MRVQTFSRSLGWPANGHPLAFLAITLAISVAASAQVTQFFTWQGDNNNNWQNSANWGQTPGSGDVPDATNHQVRFDDTANRLNVDLNNNDRTVGKITFDLASNVSYLIRSSSQNGIVRNFGDLVSPDAHNVAFDASISYFQDSDGVWTLNTNPAYMVFNCAVGGAFGNSITLDGGVTLGAANTFSGDFLITSGATAVLGNDLSLQNANVWIESGGTLDLLLNGVSPKFMTLRGPGGFNLPVGATLTVGGTVFASPNTYSGVIVSGASSTLTKLGGATWQLSASNMFPGTINIDAGAIRPTLSDTLALATVSINTNNGLTLPAAVDATLGGLAGSGNLNIGATTTHILKVPRRGEEALVDHEHAM